MYAEHGFAVHALQASSTPQANHREVVDPKQGDCSPTLPTDKRHSHRAPHSTTSQAHASLTCRNCHCFVSEPKPPPPCQRDPYPAPADVSCGASPQHHHPTTASQLPVRLLGHMPSTCRLPAGLCESPTEAASCARTTAVGCSKPECLGPFLPPGALHVSRTRRIGNAPL
jgi:hypothetical protein